MYVKYSLTIKCRRIEIPALIMVWENKTGNEEQEGA
jgi:hypothetical protein